MKIKNTISTIFLLPSLGLKAKDIEENGFINAFSYEENEDKQYEDACYVAFKPKNTSRFADFVEGEYSRTHLLIDEYDYEGGIVILVYKLPIEWQKDYELIRLGKYSHTSDEFQQLFPKVKKIKDKNNLYKNEVSLAWMIFKRDNNLREYWEKSSNIVKVINDFNGKESWKGENEVDDKVERIIEYTKAYVPFDDNMETWVGWDIDRETLKLSNLNE